MPFIIGVFEFEKKFLIQTWGFRKGGGWIKAKQVLLDAMGIVGDKIFKTLFLIV